MQSSQPWMAWSWWCRTKICGFPLAPSPLLMAGVGGLIVHALISLFVFTLDSTFSGLSVWFCRKEVLFGAEGIRQRWEPRKMHDTSPLVPFNWFVFFHMWNPLHNTFIMVFSMFLNPPNKTSHGRFHTEISHTLCVYIYSLYTINGGFLNEGTPKIIQVISRFSYWNYHGYLEIPHELGNNLKYPDEEIRPRHWAACCSCVSSSRSWNCEWCLGGKSRRGWWRWGRNKGHGLNNIKQ